MPRNLRRTLMAGIAVIVVANAAALGGAAFNRATPPDSSLVLSQRELNVPYNFGVQREDSRTSLSLVWRSTPATTQRNTYQMEADSWLDAAKLKELGMVDSRTLSELTAGYGRALPRDVLLVLEMNGPAYRHMLEQACTPSPADSESQAKAHQESCENETRSASRLFLVDAGLDRVALRGKYPDRHQYAIVPGRVVAWWTSDDSGRHATGHVEGLAVNEIQVPKSLLPDLRANVSQFSAPVNFGRKLEPWLASIDPVK